MLNRAEKNTTEDNPLKIGTLLVNEGFIRNTDLQQAIEIQEKEIRHAELSLGKLLVKNKLIDRGQLQALLQHPELVGQIETFAVEKARVHPRDLARCIAEKPASQPLPEALADAGYLSDDGLKLFFETQLDSLKICELAVETGMVSESDMARTLQSKRAPRTIGEILCDLNLITPLDLNAVMAKHRKHLGLGDMLLRQEIIDAPTFHRAMQMHEQEGTPVGSILRREGVLSENQLYAALAHQHNIPFERLEGFEYSADEKAVLTKIVGKTFCDQFHILPLHLAGSTLTVAVSDPGGLVPVHSLRSKRVDMRIECVLVTPATLQRLYVGLYGAQPALFPQDSRAPSPPPPPSPPDRTETESNLPAAADSDPPQGAEAPAPTRPAENETNAQATGQLVNRIFREALSRGARAIHIDRGLRRTTIDFRIGDTLQSPSEPWPDDAFQRLADRVVNTVKEIAGMDTAGRHRPQEGMFRAGMSDPAESVGDLDFSVTTCPTLAGENMIIKRIFPCSPAPELAKLPHSRPVIAALKQAMAHPAGMFLVAGTPGSDRAATLYAMLRHLHEPGFKAVTVDEAIAFSLPEAVQIQANASMGLPYAAMLRTALRLDPDLILAGDLVDPESALLVIEAVRRGSRLLGGINAVDAAAAVSEISALGRPAQAAGLLKAVLAQRYVRKICPACKQSYTPPPEEWQPLFERLPAGLTFYRGTGCPECSFSGYQGRLLLSELLVISDAIARAMTQQLPENDIRHLVIRSGAKTLIDDGLSKLDRTTLSEIVDALPGEAAEAFKCIRADARPAAPRTPASDENDVPEKKEAAFEVVLPSGEFPKTEIQRLHRAYEALAEETGGRARPSSGAVFETFIRAHHSALCRRYGCHEIAFSVARQHGRPLVLAMPVFS